MSFFIKFIAFSAIGTILLFAVISIFIGFEHVWSKIGGDPSSQLVEISTVTKTPKPNQYLVCPEGFCEEVPDQISPVFNVSVDKLREVLTSIESADANLTKVNSDADDLRQKYIWRSLIWRFPNLISVEIIPLENEQSTIAIYAQAQLGQSDLGANKAFVDELLHKISSEI
jgi:uncharacterized protein (DUF1499 family)